jgi:hypothetical protein
LLLVGCQSRNDIVLLFAKNIFVLLLPKGIPSGVLFSEGVLRTWTKS